jgi:tRNA threonylcarbamoyladenosine biosynthesis protein TsaB
MIILAIDTATDSVSVAFGDGKRVLAHSEAISDRQHAEALTPMIEFVRQRAGISFREIDAVAVDIGPGLFTGMRVGIASAKAIAQTLDVPLIGVASLDILAQAIGPIDDVVVSVIDARRGEMYWSMYRQHQGATTQVHAPCVGPLTNLIVDVVDRGQRAHFVGDGAVRYRSEIEDSLANALPGFDFADERLSRPTAATMMVLAHQRAVNEQWQPAHEVAPMYLRQPDAEINWQTRSAS